MDILTVRNKALLRFLAANDARGIGPDLLPRIRNILAALISARDIESITGPPGWRIHQLSGNRSKTWSISASGNWRITFEIENNCVINLDLEDYH